MARESTEADAVRRVAERLRIAYQGRCGSGQVDAAVAAAAEHFDDSRVRDFVPVLVERRARSILASAAVREADDVAHTRHASGIAPAQAPSTPHGDAASRRGSSSRASVFSRLLTPRLSGKGTRPASDQGQ
ncbi:three-helix bundle dimerization domain-containing protein [Streptomyces sp. NBC_00637]|uniref:three-helix bundle dimerization domain-containing protein n=1 Tax=Streptomyces sp. NBC_00637 TaxID=2903667 RepID=UPI00386F380E